MQLQYSTKEQRVVTEQRLKAGYEFMGYFQNHEGIKGLDICMVKGRHRMHINALGYDSYVHGTKYTEVMYDNCDTY